MNNYFLPTSGSKHGILRSLMGGIMLCSLVLQTSVFAPLVAHADVLVNVSHTDGSVTPYTFSSPDNVIVSYTMGDSASDGTPTLSALASLLDGLNSAVASANTSVTCSGNATINTTASASASITVDGVTTQANATAHSSVTCTTDPIPPQPINTKPVITVIGSDVSVMQDSVYTDLGATVFDHEDGDITLSKLVTTGTVNTAVVGTYTITYNATDSQALAADTKTRLVTVLPLPTPSVCAVDFVSDTTTLIDETLPSVATYAGNSAWTASIPGATWIWSSFSVTNPAIDQTNMFTKSVTLSDPIASASLTVAADNNFSARVNAVEVGANQGGVNYANTHVFNVASFLHTGTNMLSFTVKNIGLVGSTPTSNPAGLLYKLHVEYNKVGCTTPPPPVNQAPVITLIGANPLIVHINTVFVDPGATALDHEDGDITASIATTSTVNMAQVGNYQMTYNVTDSQGSHATEVIRTVIVQSACSDGVDNDADGLVDLRDIGCTNANDDNENTPPVISLIGQTPLFVVVGTTFTEPGANATDTEDCIDLTQSACNTTLSLAYTGTVNTAILGTYTLTYSAVDANGAHALPVSRVVNVVSGGETINHAPVITLIGTNPLVVRVGMTFVDPKATVFDQEDGQIDNKLVATGTVDTLNVGNYIITYNATDSQALAATPVTRTVTVVSACSDGIDNDGDTLIDMEDTGCTTPNDDSENSKPIITLIGDAVMQLLVGSTFTDPSATVWDEEDGQINDKLVATGTVNTSVVGSYTISYNATDSQALAADTKTRTVNIYQNTIPGCTANCGGESNTRPVITMLGDDPLQVTRGTTFTDPGATAYDQEDGDITRKIVTTGLVDATKLGTYTLFYNVVDAQNLPAQEKRRTVNVIEGTIPGCTANCGGGGGSVSLSIYNEKLTVTGTTSVTVTWNTNINADSRVVYGLNSVPTLAPAPYYGYSLTNATDTTQTTNHAMVITGIPSAIATYFRPVSSNGNQTATGIELTRTPDTFVSGGSCEYLKEYMRIGLNNNPTEVLKLQMFLKNFEGFTSLSTSSFFDQQTDAAVRAFQDKYKDDVLTPWDLPGNTGYVYYTTKKKINEIYCQHAFPLDNTQLAEIATFRDLIKRLGNPTNVNAGTVLPIVGVNTTTATGNGAVAGAATVKNVDETKAIKTPTENKPIAGGRIALADLLAISPKVSGALDAATDTAVIEGSTTEGLTQGAQVIKRNFLQAAVGGIAHVTKISEKTVLFVLFLILIALIVGGYIARRYLLARATANEVEV